MQYDIIYVLGLRVRGQGSGEIILLKNCVVLDSQLRQIWLQKEHI